MSDQFSEKPADFPAQKAYPREPGAPPAPVVKRLRPSPFRYVLPGVLFVAMVGAIAWITQFMPTWRGKNDPAPANPDATSAAAVIKFRFNKAIWDRDFEEYALEQERGHKGHFDFPFENSAAQPAEIGLLRSSCDCSHLELCLLPSAEWEQYSQEVLKDPLAAKAGNWTWVTVAQSDTKGFEVPAGAKGLVRVGWDGRKDPGARLRLSLQLWHQPHGKVSQRNFDTLEVPIMIAPPLMFRPARMNVGNLGPRDSASADFTVWSSTRADFELKFDDNSDPLFVHKSTRFSKDECRDLEKKLRKGGESTRILQAYHVTVTVHEQAAGKQLDQGPFYHAANFVVDDDKIGPLVLGAVRGDIVVGNPEDRGKVDLKIFRAKEGATREVSLWTDDKMILQQERHTPATLEVNLTKQEKVGNRAKWLLEVTVPPNTHFGAFTEESVIILRTQSTPPRFIRIPVAGNAQS